MSFGALWLLFGVACQPPQVVAESYCGTRKEQTTRTRHKTQIFVPNQNTPKHIPKTQHLVASFTITSLQMWPLVVKHDSEPIHTRIYASNGTQHHNQTI